MTTRVAPARALLYVQHLHGIGHVARMQRIAAALVAAGLDVTMVQGGGETGLPSVPGVSLRRLAPVKVITEDMVTLRHLDGRVFGPTEQAERRDALLAVLEEIRPDLLLIEAFPFGRRQLRFELIPLLEAAKAIGVAVIAASVRDVLRDKRKPGRAEETVATIERYFDRVLVHGDADATPLAATFPLAGAIAGKLCYTGLVGPEPSPAAGKPVDIVVSVGGGAFGTPLIETALRAAALPAGRERSWLVLSGQNLPEADLPHLRQLADLAGPQVDFRRTVPDLGAHLAKAGVSVSQAGYNTVADILVAGCRAVLVPFVTEKENEQRDRTATLAARGRVLALSQTTLTPEGLLETIETARRLPQPSPLRMDGARVTTEILLQMLAESRSQQQRGVSRISSQRSTA